MADNALAASAAAGVPSRDVFVPRAGATPTELAQAARTGQVTPLYGQYSPAPIGLAYYGLSANPNGNGSVVATILNASSLYATFDPNATGVLPAYPFSSSPDAYGVQVNAVSTSINLFGNSTYSFWTQNVVEYYAQLHVMYLVTNVWNFSGGALSSNAFYSTTLADGAVDDFSDYGALGYYYSEDVISNVVYPFNLGLWMNNSLVGGRNAVNFTISLSDPSSPGVSGVYAYDAVTFNSTAAAPSNYTADGENYNPIGLTNDFEVILGGPGGGSTADLFAAYANLTLQYWNSTTGSYQSVPAAYSYGGETGETVTGGYVGWENNTTTGAPYGVLTTGPSILDGLWNATGAAGLEPVTFDVTPTNAFYFVAPNWTSNFTYEGDPYWAPQELDGGTFWLAPGNYNVTIALSYFDEADLSFVVASSPVLISGSLTPDASLGIYTPLYFWQNSQFAPLSSGGSGTPNSPYQINNTQTYLFPSVFGLFNDYTFPVFTGVLVWGTDASVSFSGMPALETGSPYLYFPSTNDLGYTFYDASNISLVNSTQISGWFTDYLYYGIGYGFDANYYGTFSVLEWNATNVLIANDTFLTMTAGLSLSLGTNNTVWGNTFVMVPIPTFAACSLSPPVCPLNLSLGLQAAEGGDTIYNNAFFTSVTASEPPFNLYTGNLDFWTNTWNIPPTPAATVNFAPNWPDFPLTGTIIGNATQGGNYWWDYGNAYNPMGILPYDEFEQGILLPQIYDGGDFYPLVYSIVFTETGLPAGTSWPVLLDSEVNSSTTSSIGFFATNGEYNYSVGGVAGYSVTSNGAGNVTLDNAFVFVAVTYAAIPPKTYTVTFTEAGLASGAVWSITLNGLTEFSGTTTVAFVEPAGTYSYTVGAVLGYATPSGGSVKVTNANVGVSVTYTALPPPPTYALAFSESGLPSGTSWTVTVNGASYTSTTSTINVTGLATGTYTYSVEAVTGYTASPDGGTVDISTSDQSVSVTFTAVPTPPPTYTITFTESGLPSGTSWSLMVNGQPYSSSTSSISVTGVVGSYTYAVESVSGYSATPTGGTVSLTSTGATVTIAFATTGSSTSSGSSGLTSTEWAIIGLIIGLVIGGLVVALLMRGRGGSAKPAPAQNAPVQSWKEGDQEPPKTGGGTS